MEGKLTYRLIWDEIHQAIVARNYAKLKAHPDLLDKINITHLELAYCLAQRKGISDIEVEILTFIDMHMPKPIKLSALDKIKLLK